MQKKKGISLIVLVITIIVMIILAGAIILSLNNAGIIGKANEAVEQTNTNQVKTLAELKWSEVYLDNNVAKTDEAMKEAVISKLQAEGIDTSEYVIVVTTNGVEVIDGWIQDGLKVKKGDTVLTIGDDITYEYDDTVEGTKEGINWKVLGASEKGELLILSTTEVATLQLEKPEETDVLQWQQSWITAKQQLNELCEPYVHGKNATNARSIKIEDIDRIVGYDKTQFGEGTSAEYGAEVVVKYNGTVNPTYQVSEEVKGEFAWNHELFYYYNGTNFTSVDTTKGIKGDDITTIENNLCGYPINIATTSKAYSLINEVGTYWLATTGQRVTTSTVQYAVGVVKEANVMVTALFNANGSRHNKNYYTFNVRAVVSLAPTIQLTGSSEIGWKY